MKGFPQSATAGRRFWLAAGAAGFGLYALLRASGLRFRGPPRVEPARPLPRVVILGAGFAGLAAARILSARLAGRCRILLIDRHNYHLFTPLLFQVATCAVDPHSIAYPVRRLAGRHGFSFRRGTAAGVDLDRRQVELGDGVVDYDYLVIALGSTTNFFGNRTAKEYALPLKGLEDGVAVRHRVIDALERAVVTPDEEERRSLLTFAVVGGGATGVETAAALADLVRRTAGADYPSIDRGELRVVVIEAGEKLLGPMGGRMAPIALDRLRRMGVEVWLNARAVQVGPNHLSVEDGRIVATRTTVWAAGVRCPEVVVGLAAPHGPGGSLLVDPYLQVRGWPGVYAVGDNAHIDDPRTGRPVPLLAQAAVQEGSAVAENLARAIEGRPQLPFRYRHLGNALSLGRSAGIVEVGGLVVDGLAGNLAWRLIHLARIASFRNRLALALDWALGHEFRHDTARLDLEPVAAEIASVEATNGG